MHFTCRSFIGSPSASSWSQYWEIEPDGTPLGHLFGLINLCPPSDQPELPQLGRQIINQINDLYYQSPSLPPAQQLLKVINTIASEYPLPSSGLSIYLSVIVGSHVFLAQYHSGHILLARQSRISILTQTSQQIISGPVETNDILFLSTQGFIDQISLEKIKTILVDPKIQNIEENLLSSLFSLPDQSGSAAVLIQVNPDDSDTPLPSPVLPELPAPSAPTFNPKSSKPFFLQIFNKKPIYVTSHETNEISKRKKINLIVAIVLIILLSVSSYFGYQKNQKVQTESNYQQLKTELVSKLTDANAVKNLNLDSAQELALQAQILSEKMALLNIHSDEVKAFQSQLNQLLSQTGSADSWKPTLFHDLSLTENQPHYSQLIIGSSDLILLDPTQGRIDSLGLENKNRTIVATGEQLKKATSICKINDKIYFADDQGISLVANKSISNIIQFSPASTAIRPLSLQSWNQALYLLDSGTPTIWKYTPNSQGFDQGQVWLKDVVFPPHPSSMAINGSVWVLFTDGQLVPYLHGQPESGYQSAPTIKLQNTNHLVTAPTTDILAFTDSDSLVYLFHKDGQVIAKYNFGDIKIISLSLSESTSTLYVLGQDQKIYLIKY